jgi:hypothetical protein
MASERLAGPERGLEIDPRAPGKLVERRACERLGNRVERELAVLDGDGGQAAAGDRDLIAKAGLCSSARCGDSEPQCPSAAVRLG